jgi:type II secretory pathway pseudopilin PulG
MELLIVIAVIGILAAVLVPILINSLHKGRQKQTMANIREFATGIAEYWTDNSGAGAAGAEVNVTSWLGASTIDELRSALVPDYLQLVPDRDGWGHQLDYRIQLDSPPRVYYALVRSPGRDGVFDGDAYTGGSFDSLEFDQDIVWGDGAFIRAPASFQSEEP